MSGDPVAARLTAGDGKPLDVCLSGLELPCKCSGSKNIICALQPMRDIRYGTLGPHEGTGRSVDLADLLPEIVFEMDLEGKLTFVNQKGYELTGYTPEDFARGLMALDVLTPEDRDRAARNIRAILAGEADGPHEYTALRKDGTEFSVLIHSAPVFREGNPVGLRGVMIDMTERKRAETDLRIVDSAMACSINGIAATLVTDKNGEPIRMMASFIDVTNRKRAEQEREQELMRREKLHGALEMAGAACHEFNQPLQVISGYADLLLRDRRGSGLGCDELERIKAASDRMMEISRKIQQITRYETREYVGGATIIDIDKSSCLTAPEDPET
jgi:PAS domain S-box-containing protein